MTGEALPPSGADAGGLGAAQPSGPQVGADARPVHAIETF